MRAAARSPFSVSRTASTTDAPRAARTRAVSNPRPVFAPVTTASRPCWPGTSPLVHLAVMIPPDTLLYAGLACPIPGQPRGRLGEPASHVRVIHARPVGTASARSLPIGVAGPLAMTRRGPADLPSGPGKLDMKPAGRLPGAAACRSPAGPGLIASAAASEARAVACLPAAIADPPDGSATGIPQDRLPVR